MPVRGEYTPNHIFIDVGADRSIDLLGDPWAPKPRISAFHFNDDCDEFWERFLGPRFAVLGLGIQPLILALGQRFVESK